MRFVLLAALASSVLLSAVSVVYVKHESRKQFVALQRLERERDELLTEWTRLQLEHGAWATHDRIEHVASTRLHLHVPATGTVVVVTR
jgi:cell division protein FtsL